MARQSELKKVALITGASAGIGHATAKSLIEHGYTVYGAARRIHLMDDLVAAGGHAIEMDVTDSEAVGKGVARIIEDQGRIDALFANAGYCLLGAVENLPMEEVKRQFDVNVFGVGRVIQAALPHMRAQGAGTIAICSSAAGHVSMPGMVWYPATKFALQALGDGLRMELKPFGINVTLIEPGYIATSIDEASLPYLDIAAQHPEADAYAEQRENFRKNWSKGIKEGANPDTIAEVVVKAFESRKPRRRYHPNLDARAAILTERLTGNFVLDRVIPGQSIGS